MLLQECPVWLCPPAQPLEVVVVGASAGGLAPLRQILAGLLPDFRGAIMVAQHRADGPLRPYATLLQRSTRLRVVEAVHGSALAPGTIQLAPHGRHLELDATGRIYTGRQARYQTVRPSADLLFTSVAACYGGRAVAVVLSGYGRDGADGVRAIREAGGFVITQDRASSAIFGMPATAIETRRVDLVLPVEHIAFALTTLFAPAG